MESSYQLKEQEQSEGLRLRKFLGRDLPNKKQAQQDRRNYLIPAHTPRPQM